MICRGFAMRSVFLLRDIFAHPAGLHLGIGIAHANTRIGYCCGGLIEYGGGNFDATILKTV